MTTRSRSIVTGAALALVLAGAGCARTSGTDTAVPFEQGAERYEFKFTLTRARAEMGTCTAGASVRDRKTGRSIVVPIFTAPWGKETTTAVVDSTADARLEVRVEVNGPGDQGAFAASLHRGDQLIASRAVTQRVRIVEPALTPG